MSILLEIIFIIIIVYFFLRLFVIVIIPWLIKLGLRRFQRNFHQQNAPPQSDINKEGKVTIHKPKDHKDNDIPQDLGEYIDYEELNNNQKPTNE